MATVPRAGRREWIGLAVIALPCLVYSMDLTVLYLAVPALTADLDPSGSQLLWITDIYGFLLAACLVTMGALGDRIGRRRLLMIGAAAFAVCSVLAAFSTSAEMLIASRALLGVAAATLAPSTLALVRNMFSDPRQRTVAIGIWVASFSAGGALGPVVGGALLEFFWWGSVFLIAVPVMGALLILAPRLLPESRDPEPGRLDPRGAGLSLVAVLGVVYALQATAADGGGGRALAALAVGIAAGALFVRRLRTNADPLIDVGLFRTPAFSVSLAAYGLALALVYGTDLLIAQYLQLVLGFSPLVAGLWAAPAAAGFIAGSLLAPLVATRVRAGLAIAWGLVLAAGGLAAIALVGRGFDLASLVGGSVVLAVGAALVVTLGTDVIIGTAPPERAGAASGISETAAELGGALGIAVLGSIGAAVFRSTLGGTPTPGLPPGEGAAAHRTLAGAAEAAGRLPDRAGVVLLDAAHEAFARGLQVAALIGVALAIPAALAVLIALRRTVGAPERRPRATEALEKP